MKTRSRSLRIPAVLLAAALCLGLAAASSAAPALVSEAPAAVPTATAPPAAPTLSAKPASTMSFVVSMEQPTLHLFHVTFRCDGLKREMQDFKMPV